MSARHTAGLAAIACLALAVAWPGGARAAEVSSAQSAIGFTLTTRFGQTLQGRFSQPQGRIARLADGREQVELRLPSDSVEIIGSPAYTRHTRGSGFFDVGRYPQVVFVSDPYDPALLHEGGQLAGRLSIRDVTRREVLRVAPSACGQPGLGCAVVVQGQIRREDYGMRSWRAVLGSEVQLRLDVRLRGPVG